MKQILISLIFLTLHAHETNAQGNLRMQVSSKNIPDALYGTASYYANKFEGRLTANGEVFSQQKMTAACNVLPLGTWIKVTNLYNGRSVIVKVNDRLHYKNKRLVDLSKIAAKKMGYTGGGLTKVKVEPLGKKPT
jgi:peptidoglycan lytic transglycosylase